MSVFTPTSAARLHRPSHCAMDPATPPPSAAPPITASARRDRAIDSATDIPAPTPAPPAAPQHPPMTASTGTTAREASVPGVVARISPPAAPPNNPARPPPTDAPAHRAAASAAARCSLSVISSRAVATAAGALRMAPAPIPERPTGRHAAGSRKRMARARTETTKRFVSSERVEQLRRFALIFLLACGGRDADNALQQRLEGIDRQRGGATARRRCVRGGGHSASSSSSTRSAKRAVDRDGTGLTNRGSRESSPSVRGGCAEWPGRARCRTRLRRPDTIENIPAMDRFAAPFDQKYEQIEIARDERLRASARSSTRRRGRE